ncbi:MAG: cellobiose phosphorylase, partial [Vallitaleaceae bacterium]|nr:cellobiose phosphorylase [Vallitaleaceae bacterium]
SGLDGFSNWMKWIEIQPVLRKIYGCSFLPYHDYGKGGRGWRDLWQDCLSLILLEPEEVKGLLINNFGGVRIDGSNATIIGSKPGEFLADRNNIPRVWMDHGSWPYLTTKLYIDQSGDLDILLQKQSYFRDAQTRRATKKDEAWTSHYGNKLKTQEGSIYEGTIIEHILLQHLSCFYNVGEHNIIRLEGADWNDTLDMARQRGESTAFTAFYGSNLMSIAGLLRALKTANKIDSLELCTEIKVLLDTLSGKVHYEEVSYKKEILNRYFDAVSNDVTGEKIEISIDELISDLEQKGQWIFNHIKKNEFIETSDGHGFFNGYYNNDGERVDGDFTEGVRMNLTGQVFTTMFGLATDEQVLASYDSCQRYLKDAATGGYKLNTPLGPNTLNFGRGFAFAYGDKENGAIFSHMVIMYMNALYQRGFVTQAYEVFTSMYQLCMDTEHSKIYPGIPEYFSLSGKGMYHYLTGSASWLFLTVLIEMFGVKGDLGDLVLQPKLMPAQFDQDGKASVTTTFAGKQIIVEYVNEKGLDYRAYKIVDVKMNELTIEPLYIDAQTICIPRENILSLPTESTKITIILN